MAERLRPAIDYRQSGEVTNFHHHNEDFTVLWEAGVDGIGCLGVINEKGRLMGLAEGRLIEDGEDIFRFEIWRIRNQVRMLVLTTALRLSGHADVKDDDVMENYSDIDQDQFNLALKLVRSVEGLDLVPGLMTAAANHMISMGLVDVGCSGSILSTGGKEMCRVLAEASGLSVTEQADRQTQYIVTRVQENDLNE